MTKPKTDKTPPMSFGERLKALRTSREWTCEVLAEKIGITPEYISMLENGKREPRFPMVLKISKAFGMTLAEFTKGVK